MTQEFASYPFGFSFYFGKKNYERFGTILWTKPMLTGCYAEGYNGKHFEWNLGKYQCCIDAEIFEDFESFITMWSGFSIILFSKGFFKYQSWNDTYKCIMPNMDE